MGASSAAASLNLCRAFEERLLASSSSSSGCVPAVIITGFLGSGKTTLTRNLLRTRGNLRFAVVMNEIADADVDSALLGGASSNATVGLPLLSIADACACCSGAAALRVALRQVLAAAPAVDALVLETTGLADPAPLAHALAAAGARLECVVTVVDAEAVLSQLASPAQSTLRAQLQCADLVVLNKARVCASQLSFAAPPHLRVPPQCDLVDLAAMADAEDALARLTPARILRARHGVVPIAALLDVQLAPTPPEEPPAGAGGFISHEAGHASGDARFVLSDGSTGSLGGRGIKRRLEEEASASGGLLRTPHALELARISTVVWRAAGAPLCAAAFGAWLLREAAPASGLLRAKGCLFLAQCRRQRFVFHFSGARRVEALEEEAWQGPPGATVVLIGSNRAALLALRERLQALSAPPEHADDAAAAAAADAFAGLLAQDARFELEPCAAHEKDRRGFVSFGLVGMPLRGVDGAALNCTLMRRLNAAQRDFLLWGKSTQQPERMACVRIALTRLEDVGAAHACVLAHAEAVLREALAHVGLCNCG